MKRKKLALFVCSALTASNSNASIMRHDIAVQDYRDFGENLGKYQVGATNVPVYNKAGELDDYLRFAIPDFGSVADKGNITLVAPSYLASVRHNSYSINGDIKFGNKAKYAAAYRIINRNASTVSDIDFNLPRVNKVVTDAAPAAIVDKTTIRTGSRARYTWYTRVGAGTQQQVNADQTKESAVTGPYNWKTGGTMANGSVTLPYGTLRWTNDGPGTKNSSPFSNAVLPGDSGSPTFVYDEVDKQWKLAGVMHAMIYNYGIYRRTSGNEYIPDGYLERISALNRSPDVVDNITDGTVYWRPDGIYQGDNRWEWKGLGSKYQHLAPSAAAFSELDATKDIRFAGTGNTVVLSEAVNLGAGKLQFSGDYTVESAADSDATWVGGGIEVDEGKSVLWKVKGIKGDALHKIGAGTLHVNASGINAGELNVGDGLIILDQQEDSLGQKQAFSKITLVSGRPTVQLNSSDQLASQNIQFGYRGGILDLNGNAITFDSISHNDNGARIVNRNDDTLSEVKLTGNNQTFLGTFGEKARTERLTLTYAPDEVKSSWTLRGGAFVANLSIQQGEFNLGGEQVLHAGNTYFSNDWLQKEYVISSLEVADNANLTLKEHASLEAKIQVGKGATVTLWDRATLAGEVDLHSKESTIHADIRDHNSTLGSTASLISANVTGEGVIEKRGSGLLTLSGDIDNTQGINLDEGILQVTGKISSKLQMAKDTLLAGNGRINAITMADGATLSPGELAAEKALLRIGSLMAQQNAHVVLNSGFTQATTDQILIDGDLDTPEGMPISVTVNPKSVWLDSDTNKNGAADNREGISLIQVGGKSSAGSIKLKDNYVARGAWAYGLYAFAPGHASAEERQVSGQGDQYWDFRLQNIMLTADGISTPVTPTPEPTPDPTPPSDTDSMPESGPEPTPEPTPVPAPEKTRPALIPQVPTYISLPAMIRNFDQTLSSFIADSARDSRSYLFINGYGGRDSYHAAGDFTNYGYDFRTRYQGWVIGGRWQSDESFATHQSLSVAAHKGNITLTPRAVDGQSRGHFSSHGLTSLFEWHDDQGLLANLNLGYSQFRGSVTTGARGKVAAPRASVWHAGIEAGKSWQIGNHRLTPLLGIDYQYIDINSFTDRDGAKVRYNPHNSPTYSAGIRYQWQAPDYSRIGMTFTNELRVRVNTGKAPQTLVSGGGDEASFQSGRGGDHLLLKSGIEVKLTDQIALTTQAQYQQRLQREGISDWGIIGGVKVLF